MAVGCQLGAVDVGVVTPGMLVVTSQQHLTQPDAVVMMLLRLMCCKAQCLGHGLFGWQHCQSLAGKCKCLAAGLWFCQVQCVKFPGLLVLVGPVHPESGCLVHYFSL